MKKPLGSISIQAGTILIFIRHGESESNATGVLGGQQDSPLTERGHQQAERVADFLEREHLDLIVTSDLSRAAETATIIADRLGLPIIESKGLREMDIGAMANLSMRELREEMMELRTSMHPEDGFKEYGGESMPKFAKRVSRALSRLSKRHGGKTWGVVTHGGVINWFLHAILGGDSNPLTSHSFIAVGNCTPSRVRVLESPDRRQMWRVDYVGLPLVCFSYSSL